MPRPSRLRALDLTRFVAIALMMVVHWQGVFMRFPGRYVDPLLWLGRMATPGFVTVFGLTLGYVFFPRYLKDPLGTRSQIARRALKTLKYALIVSIPQFAKLAWEGQTDPGEYVRNTYSVLAFYVLGIATVPVWFGLVRRAPKGLPVVLGAALWLVGGMLREAWQPSALVVIDYPRVLLVAGPYAYFNLMACALLAMPLGVALRENGHVRSGRAFVRVTLLGVALCTGGLLVGAWLTDFSLEALIKGEWKYPPRAWYFAHFAGLTLVLFGLLGFAESRGRLPIKGLAPLETLGQSPLQLYTAQEFVYPGTRFLAAITGLRTEVTFAINFSIFAAWCGWLVTRRAAIVSPRSGGQAP